MRTTHITKTLVAAALALTGAAGLACTKASASAANSPYCDLARQWSVHELDPRNNEDPAVYRPYWQEYLAFVDKGARLAPSPIHGDWVAYRSNVLKETPILEKYGYDHARFEASTTADEKAIFDGPGAAFNNILGYEASTCSAGQPPAANVKFTGDKDSAYCRAVAKNNEAGQTLRDSGYHAAELRAAYADPNRAKNDAEIVSTAPAEIKGDVRAVVAWSNDQQTKVTVKYGYDVRKLLLTGTDKERRAFQLTDPKISQHLARTGAYEQQVCGQ